MHSREIVLERLETFAHHLGLREKAELSRGMGESTTVYSDGEHSVTAEFLDYGTCLILEVAREEIIGGVPFVVTIPVREFARVSGEKERWQEHDADFQMRILESRTSAWFAGDHSAEPEMHRKLRRSSPAQ